MIESKQRPELTVQLRSLCMRKIFNEVISDSGPEDLTIQWIPIELSQEVFDLCVEQTVAEEINNVFKLFLKDPTKTPLQRLSLQNFRRADPELILELLRANIKSLTHVDVRGCRTLPKKFWCLVNHAPNLKSLKTTKILAPLRCPSLETLVVDWKPRRVVQKVQSKVQNMYYDKLLETVLPNLRYLDMSWCPWIKRLKSLRNATNLEVLILRHCDVTCIMHEISQLTQLRALDISVGLRMESEVTQDFNGDYRNPESILAGIVTSLVNLNSLDISGTNLITVCQQDENILNNTSTLKSRDGNPLKFLGLYSTIHGTCNTENLPALRVASSDTDETLMNAIKRNSDMPKTLHSQLLKLKIIRGATPLDPNELLPILLKMLKNIRLTEHFRYWGLKCTNTFLDYLGTNPGEIISPDMRRELFLVLNRLLHSHVELEKIPEPILCYTFKIFLKLLPTGCGKQGPCDDGTRREIMRLGKFLMSQNSMAFVYLKTEALLFRLLYQISLEQEVCAYLSENKAIPNCLDFFKTLQIYLGFALSIRQTAEIVPLVWKSILNFLKASPVANQDFVKHCGLSWMYSHASWFTNDQETQTDLCKVFMEILNQLDKYIVENQETCCDGKPQNVKAYAQELMLKLKTVINENVSESE